MHQCNIIEVRVFIPFGRRESSLRVLHCMRRGAVRIATWSGSAPATASFHLKTQCVNHFRLELANSTVGGKARTPIFCFLCRNHSGKVMRGIICRLIISLTSSYRIKPYYLRMSTSNVFRFFLARGGAGNWHVGVADEPLRHVSGRRLHARLLTRDLLTMAFESRSCHINMIPLSIKN